MLFAPLFALALAASPVPDPPPIDWTVAPVEVRPGHHGPVLWRVSKGETEVWILGQTETRNLGPWDTREVERLIARSKVVYTGSEMHLGFISGLGMMFTQSYKLPGGQTIDSFLSPDQRQSFHQTLKSAHLKGDEFDHFRPGFSAVMIAAGANSGLWSPFQVAKRLAQQHHVKAGPAVSINAAPLAKQLFKVPDAEGATCAMVAVDELSYQLAHAEPIAKAWSEGDFHSLRPYLRPSNTWDCLIRIGAFSSVLDRSISDTSKDVASAVDHGGGAFFVIGMMQLLRKDGVLDTLRAEGYRVDTPDE